MTKCVNCGIEDDETTMIQCSDDMPTLRGEFVCKSCYERLKHIKKMAHKEAKIKAKSPAPPGAPKELKKFIKRFWKTTKNIPTSDDKITDLKNTDNSLDIVRLSESHRTILCQILQIDNKSPSFNNFL